MGKGESVGTKLQLEVRSSGVLCTVGQLRITIMFCIFQKAGGKDFESFHHNEMINEKTDMFNLT